MIKYKLRCADDHEFECWFGSIADYDSQAAEGLLACPYCGSDEVSKAIMAPRIGAASGAIDQNATREAYRQAMRRARDFVEKHYDYVGDRFPEEARRIHYGETESRRIYGEATGVEVSELISEGVAIAPVPGAPAQERMGAPRSIAPRKGDSGKTKKKTN